MKASNTQTRVCAYAQAHIYKLKHIRRACVCVCVYLMTKEMGSFHYLFT